MDAERGCEHPASERSESSGICTWRGVAASRNWRASARCQSRGLSRRAPHALYCGMKSSVDEIRQRFDADVERFSNLETGQSSTVDAPLALELIVRAAAATTPAATHLLDVGAGAGNYTLKMLEALPGLDVTLVDLSRPMLDRAERAAARVDGARRDRPAGRRARARARRGPLRPRSRRPPCCITCARTRSGRRCSPRFFRALRPGGSLWIFDLVEHSIPPCRRSCGERYGEYLTALRDEAYRDHVFAYVEREDTPRPLVFQLDLLRRVGFAEVDVLHKNGCFAAFGAVKRDIILTPSMTTERIGLQVRTATGPGVLHRLTGVIAHQRGDISSVAIASQSATEDRVYFEIDLPGARRGSGRRARAARRRARRRAGGHAQDDLRQADHHHGRRRAGRAGRDRRDLRGRPPQHPRRADLGGHDPARRRAAARRRGARRGAAAARLRPRARRLADGRRDREGGARGPRRRGCWW